MHYALLFSLFLVWFQAPDLGDVTLLLRHDLALLLGYVVTHLKWNNTRLGVERDKLSEKYKECGIWSEINHERN